MSTPIDVRITPALHDENITQLDGYDETTAPLLSPVAEALSDAYITLGKIHDARDAAKKNGAWTEGQQVLNVADAAYKQQQRLLKKMDGLVATLDKQAQHFERELQTPLESKAAIPIAAEIRKHMKDLPTEKRHEFLRQAINEGDAVSASAVLGAPPYLSGIDAGFSKTYTRMWNERMTPELAQKLRAVQSAKAMIEARAPLIHEQVEKAMGADWGTVSELRRGNDKALAALKFDAQ